jgi:putative hemolysin
VFTGNSRGICNRLIRRSRDPPDTSRVIAKIRQKVPLRLELLPTPVVEIAVPAHAAGVCSPVARPHVSAEVGNYRLRLAESQDDREAACRLRFRVFNVELGEGLDSSYENGLDFDRFDPCCEHLLVEERASRRIVGTYRMQTGASAARNLGYYSEQEFVLTPYEVLRGGILELGRAAVDREHRTPEVLTLLWRGIAQYAVAMGQRYLLGCSSMNSNNPAEGWQMFSLLDRFRVAREFETVPTVDYACPTESHADAQPSVCAEVGSTAAPVEAPLKIPRLLKAYLALGARIAAPPAWDREFRTIDFLTLLDLETLAPAARERFLGPLTS